MSPSAVGPANVPTAMFAMGGNKVNKDAFVNDKPTSCVKYVGNHAKTTYVPQLPTK